MRQTINKIKNFCLNVTVLVIVFSNVINYFYAYKHLQDLNLQWIIAIISISISMFLMSFYIWLDQSMKSGKTILSGWVSIFLFINLIGVIMGYNLHTKGFMMILFTVIIGGLSHLAAKL